MTDERDVKVDVIAHELGRPLAAAEDADDSWTVRQGDADGDRVHFFTTASPGHPWPVYSGVDRI